MVISTAEPPIRNRTPLPVDELALVTPPVAELYRHISQILLGQEQQSLIQTASRAERLMRELGVTFNLYGEEAGQDHIVPFDPFPRVINPEDWAYLYRGLQQRLRLWNAFFKDIYQTQEVLKSGTMPFEIIYDDPHYQRAAVGIDLPRDIYCQVAGFDLARGSDGQWMVIDDYTSAMTGASYALQSRYVLSQVCPDLLRTADIEPIHGYPTDLLEHLREFSQGRSSEPRVVLLSSGAYNAAYYEHSYLARQMGIPLVRGNDLIVLNTRVYLKTIGGLEPIDVIYRRLDDRWIDPLALARENHSGVPGLMTCVRKGTLTIANAIGTGLGDNRAVSAYLPRLAKFYLNEPLLIPSIRRYLCRDPDQCDEIVANLRDYWIATVNEPPHQRVYLTSGMPEPELEKLRADILSRPADFVAEPYLPLNLLPSAASGRCERRHAGLRIFAFAGARQPGHPCALTRVASQPESRIISSGLGGGIKDTWILRGASQKKPAPPITLVSERRRLRLGSRIAESLYWLGRYAERAENTTRIFKVLQLIQLEDQARQDPQTWAPLWETLARATGHSTNFFKRSALLRKGAVSHYILLDVKNPSSVLSCVERCRLNAQSTRESVPPEIWVVITRLHQLLEEAVPPKRGKLSDETELAKIQELQENVLNQLNALTGAAAKSMLRDDGWHFWLLGLHVERAITTVLVMKQVLVKRHHEQNQEELEDTNIDALLRMLACLYAYRSLFQSRPVSRNAAALLLQDPQLPRSVAYCLDRIGETLGTVFGQNIRERADSPLRECNRLKAEVNFVDLDGYFVDDPKKSSLFRRWLEKLADELTDLSMGISDHYLYHQSINTLP